MAPTESNKFSGMLVVIAVLAIIGVVAVSLFRPLSPITVQTGPQSPDRNILTVTGTHELDVAPDEAQLTFEVVTRATQAAQASTMNRDLLNKVMDALHAHGVKDADIETTGVTLGKVTEWDYTNQKSVDKGYEQRTTLRVTLKDLSKVGDVLDGAVQAGANNVQDIQFTLTPESELKYKQQALADAAKTAKDKAQTLASASGATLGKITSLSEDNYNYVPYYANSGSVMMDKAMVGGEVPAPSTPITPQKVTITVTVSIGYELQ